MSVPAVMYNFAKFFFLNVWLQGINFKVPDVVICKLRFLDGDEF
jgi:hypothetical protein